MAATVVRPISIFMPRSASLILVCPQPMFSLASRSTSRRSSIIPDGRQAMNPKPIELANTPDLALALPALRRARKRAEEIATDTALVQVRDGQVIRARPEVKHASTTTE